MRGEETHGDVSSADASSGVAFKLYKAEGDEYTLASTDRLVITDFAVVSAAGGAVMIVTDTDAQGKRVFKGTVAANGGIARRLCTPYYCPRGVMPVLIAPAGQVDAQLTGYILRS